MQSEEVIEAGRQNGWLGRMVKGEARKDAVDDGEKEEYKGGDKVTPKCEGSMLGYNTLPSEINPIYAGDGLSALALKPLCNK